jgi:hypothetical protein
MKRLPCLGLCLGLLPFAAGCVESANATDGNKADEKAKADPPPSDAKKAKRTPMEFGELPANDPLVANAIQAREQVADLEEELLQQLDDLRAALAAAKADPDRLRQSVDLFLEVTKAMRQKTLLANEAVNALGEKTAELSRSSRHLASSYRALADLFRKKARDYSEKKLRDQLLGFAKDYDDVAASIPEHCKSLDAIQKKLPALKRKVKEVNLFLTDAVSFLNSHPGLGTDPREKYAPDFESFAVTFTEWLRVLDDLRSTLRERAVSKVIRESYRQEVDAFQKLEAVEREEQARIERARQDEVAKAEQAKRDEESRLAKLVSLEQEKLALERERLAKERGELAQERERLAKAETNPPVPNATVMPVTYTPAMFVRQPCVCPTARPCRVRLFPLFRRG